MATKMQPIVFTPLFQERIWGGRRLESDFGKPLRVGKAIGESWEISDRPGDESTIEPIAHGRQPGWHHLTMIRNRFDGNVDAMCSARKHRDLGR